MHTLTSPVPFRAAAAAVSAQPTASDESPCPPPPPSESLDPSPPPSESLDTTCAAAAATMSNPLPAAPLAPLLGGTPPAPPTPPLWPLPDALAAVAVAAAAAAADVAEGTGRWGAIADGFPLKPSRLWLNSGVLSLSRLTMPGECFDRSVVDKRDVGQREWQREMSARRPDCTRRGHGVGVAAGRFFARGVGTCVKNKDKTNNLQHQSSTAEEKKQAQASRV